MQTAGARDRLFAGAQMQVVRVRQNDLGAELMQLIDRDGFDGATRAHRHERRRLDDAVRKLQSAAPSGAVTVRELKNHSGVRRTANGSGKEPSAVSPKP